MKKTTQDMFAQMEARLNSFYKDPTIVSKSKTGNPFNYTSQTYHMKPQEFEEDITNSFLKFPKADKLQAHYNPYDHKKEIDSDDEDDDDDSWKQYLPNKSLANKESDILKKNHSIKPIEKQDFLILEADLELVRCEKIYIDDVLEEFIEIEPVLSNIINENIENLVETKISSAIHITTHLCPVIGRTSFLPSMKPIKTNKLLKKTDVLIKIQEFLQGMLKKKKIKTKIKKKKYTINSDDNVYFKMLLRINYKSGTYAFHLEKVIDDFPT